MREKPIVTKYNDDDGSLTFQDPTALGILIWAANYFKDASQSKFVYDDQRLTLSVAADEILKLAQIIEDTSTPYMTWFENV